MTAAVDPDLPDLDATAWETVLAMVILEVSGLRMPADASFFEAGLTSATLVGVFERLAGRLPPGLPVTVFFKYPTRRSLARHLAGQAALPATTLPTAAGRTHRSAVQDRRDLRSRLRERKG
ncbi:hypothetical protein GCM10022225_07980 [Plantactinospora mayteni]|uniref:Carrier domain-containing protein n=1 Tax=Plantactinospora mayteni TaxID=566021 RepID=A0ABQ4EJN9_9ACTN|nr:acyl carrier protein [Plantactinospora mayteni]GIG94456.1 hypothetical protein Pma05_10290 [Plantactinospora mayteni]